jgi:hypothetical protein
MNVNEPIDPVAASIMTLVASQFLMDDNLFGLTTFQPSKDDKREKVEQIGPDEWRHLQFQEAARRAVALHDHVIDQLSVRPS